MADHTKIEWTDATKKRVHGSLPGPDNHNWKGGRVVDPRGYVLIKVGVDHPLADVRGYAYEHRLKAYERGDLALDLGPLHVHHKDDNPSNNADENLEVLTPWEHHVRHRSADKGLRMPGEPNPDIICACGCGAVFKRYDSSGRPRAYVSGHNPQPAPTLTAILNVLRSSERQMRVRTIADEIATTPRAVSVGLQKLRQNGLVVRVPPVYWRLSPADPNQKKDDHIG